MMNKKQMGLLFMSSILLGALFGMIMWVISVPRGSFIITVLAGIVSVWVLAVLILGIGIAIVLITELYDKWEDKEEVIE